MNIIHPFDFFQLIEIAFDRLIDKSSMLAVLKKERKNERNNGFKSLLSIELPISDSQVRL